MGDALWNRNGRLEARFSTESLEARDGCREPRVGIVF